MLLRKVEAQGNMEYRLAPFWQGHELTPYLKYFIVTEDWGENTSCTAPVGKQSLLATCHKQ